MIHIGYCIGGENHGKIVESKGDIYRLPIMTDVSEIIDFSDRSDMNTKISYEEYEWCTMILNSGRKFQFWKHTSITSRDQLLAVLIKKRCDDEYL